MHYLKLIGLWSTAFFALSLGISTAAPFGLSASAPRLGDSKIYPTYRFYRGGAYASVTESTLEQVFRDRLVGVPREDGELPKRLARHLYRLCIRHRLDPSFVLSVIQVESGFRADAISSAGAIGLMQVMPETARVLAGHPVSAKALRDPFISLELGVAYLRKLKVKYSGLSPYYALAAYNMGPKRLDHLRASPGFRPDKSLKYFEDIMRGVGDWRRYGSQALHEVSSLPRQRSALKTKPDAELRTSAKRTDPA